jgi:hypothetical protein
MARGNLHGKHSLDDSFQELTANNNPPSEKIEWALIIQYIAGHVGQESKILLRISMPSAHDARAPITFLKIPQTTITEIILM